MRLQTRPLVGREGLLTQPHRPEEAVHADTARATARSQPRRSTRQRPRFERIDAAAERFFGVPHADLFTHLVEVLEPLPRPRRGRR